jgi:hypothetical protein
VTAAILLAVTGAGSALASHAATYRFTARLVGKNEVPTKGPLKASGMVNITITGSKVCWAFKSLKGIDKPIAAHIHKGKIGQSGPVVVPLNAKFTASGCIFPSSTTVKAIEANPKSFYVNVHTKRYPNGAIRGQLQRMG